MDYNWEHLRDKATAAFGEPLGAKLEQTLIDRFNEDPEHVTRTINRIIKAHQRKPFDSPWAVIRTDLDRQAQATVTTAPSTARQKLIDQGKTFIRNAGHYHPTWQDCKAELFGTEGLTAPLEYLVQLEEQTRDNPGRAIYNGLLQAAIVRAKLFGREPIPDEPNAPLYSLRNDTDAHTELEAEWVTHRVRTLKAEADHEAWNAKAKADRHLVLALRSKPTSEDIDFT